MTARWQVWAGALTASPGLPQPGDRWVDCEVIEERGARCYVSTVGGSPLWVLRAHVRNNRLHAIPGR